MRRLLVIMPLAAIASPTLAGNDVIFVGGFEDPLADCPVTRNPSFEITADDSDGDGANDCWEEILGTLVLNEDTDGDGQLDGFEADLFDPDSDPFKFNPRVSDVPELDIRFTSVPEIILNYTSTLGADETVATERTSETSQSSTSSVESSVSVGLEVSVTNGASASLTDIGVSSETTVTGSVETSTSWSSSQTRENREAFSHSQSVSQREDTTFDGGTLRVEGVELCNAGNLSMKVTELRLVAGVVDPEVPGSFETIGTGTLQVEGGFPETDLGVLSESCSNPSAPQYTFLGDVFQAELDDEQTAQQLLRDARNIIVKPQVATLLDENAERSFSSQETLIAASTATVLIDYGSVRKQDKFYVAPVTDSINRRIYLHDVLGEVLTIPYAASAATGITSINGVAADETLSKRWVAIYRYFDGGEERIELLNPASEPYDVSQIELRPGWTISLIHLEDQDGDGIGYREELINGASDLDTDSDGDGLNDFDELRIGWIATDGDVPVEVFSNPGNADVDNDGFTDLEEMMAQTHPNIPNYNPDLAQRRASDFNADGLPDLLVSAPGSDHNGIESAGLVHVLQRIGVGSGAPVNAKVRDPVAFARIDQRMGDTLATGFFNDDAYADAVIGAPAQSDGGGPNRGGIRILFGSSSGLPPVLNCGGVDPRCLRLSQVDLGDDASDDRFGYAIATGDFDGDGLDDIAVSHPYENASVSRAGRVTVLYSTPTGPDINDPQSITQNTDGVLSSEEVDDFFGMALSAGDFNNDGIDDLAIGSPRENVAFVDSGFVQVMYGQRGQRLSGTFNNFNQGDTLRPGIDEQENDQFGYSMAVGDLNGDGADDLLVSSPTDVIDAGQRGRIQIIFGESGNALDIGPQHGMNFSSPCLCGVGFAGITTGDFDGNGALDFAYGTPGRTPGGSLVVHYNLGANVPNPNNPGGPAWPQFSTPVIINQTDLPEPLGEFGDFGQSLVAQDYNGDGVDDLVVGAPQLSPDITVGNTSSHIDAAGGLFVLFGQLSDGLDPDDSVSLTQPLDFVQHPAGYGRLVQRVWASSAMSQSLSAASAALSQLLVNRSSRATVERETSSTDAISS